jgi:dTDP-4-dehydrorhamnose reductase
VIEGNRRTQDPAANELKIDITDKAAVGSAMDTIRPDIVLLLAAHSDIDFCQLHPEKARAVNLDGAANVARACAATNARLVFASTGAVFDGLQHGYAEDAPLSPVSVYGETKARAEEVVSALLPGVLILRIPLAIGFALPPGSGGFLDKLRSSWSAGKTIAFPVFEQRNAIDAATCAQFILELILGHRSGIFHLGSLESISRYELGLRLAARMGFAGQVSAQFEPLPGRAPRGPDHFLLTDKLRNACSTPVPTIDQAIERCFHGIA